MHLREGESLLPGKRRFGELLRGVRAAHLPPLTQEALAHRMEVSRALVNLMEQGHRAPTREFVSRAVKALSLDDSDTAMLWEAAGFVSPAGPMTILDVEQALPTSEQNPILAHRARADVLSTIDAWRTLAEADRALRDGRYEQARILCDNLATRRHVTPSLRLYARRELAEVNRLLGKLDEAANAIAPEIIMADLPDDDVSAQGEFVRALLMAQRGEIELRRGRYEQARMCFEASQYGYSTLLDSSSYEARIVIHLSLGMAFERLAKVSLFLGAEHQAEDYCVAAALHLQSAESSPQCDEVRRKVEELRAWALARKGDFVEAISLHEEARQAAEAAGDIRGALKNNIYLGDDWRRRAEKAIEEVCRDVNGIYRARHPREAYMVACEQEPGLQEWVDCARRFYEEAMRQMEMHPVPYMKGLCMRNLGIIARFEGQFASADAWLHQAESHDAELGFHDRLPAIYEARGELYWWQGMRELAVRWYTKALESLDKLTLTPELSSSDKRDTPQRARERQRILASLEALLPLPAAQASLVRWQPDNRWYLLTAALSECVVGAIKRGLGIRVTSSESDPRWVDELADFEAIPGSRVLAQDSLSAGWSATIPRTYATVCNTTEEYAAVESAFERRRASAYEFVGDGYRDLSTTSVVFDSLESLDGRTRAQNVLSLIGQSLGKYRLTLSPFPLPLAFTVKGQRVLAEVPAALLIEAKHLVDGASGTLDKLENAPTTELQRVTQKPSQTSLSREIWCYRFDDESLADTLRIMFDRLEEVAGGQHGGNGIEALRQRLSIVRQNEAGVGI